MSVESVGWRGRGGAGSIEVYALAIRQLFEMYTLVEGLLHLKMTSSAILV